MRKLFIFPMLAMFAAATALPCFAADSPWNGTWKLNETKSQMTGTTVVITKAGKMYTINTGPISFSFACDGKDYTSFADRSISCKQDGNTFTTTRKVAGKVTSTTTHRFSADGNTMTEATNGTRPDGTAYTENDTSQRVGTGKGLAGTWKETAVKEDVPTSILLRVDGDRLHYEDVGYSDVSDTKLDGTPGPITGPRVAAGMMASTTADGSTKVKTTITMNGKEMSTDEMTLSDDGTTITDVQWSPGKESEKKTYIYEKQ